MADNTTLPTGAGGDKIATDELVTINGVSSSGEKVQRVKSGFGIDGVHRDTSAQFPLPVNTDSTRAISYFGRGSSFRIPGRAGTTGQKLFTIHNATASPVLVDIEKISIDMVCTVVKAVTVLPPAIRLYRFTALPTGGTAVTKVPRRTSQTSNGALTILADASADGTSSATALAATVTTGAAITQTFCSRLITAAGFEMFERIEFMDGVDEKITLLPLEGVALVLDYTLATQNPTTDMYLVNVKWTEYTEAA